MLEVFDNDSIRRILTVRLRDCVPSVAMGRRPCFTIMPTLFVQRWFRWLSHATSRPDSDMIKDRLMPTPTRTWNRRNGVQLSNCDRGRSGDPLRIAGIRRKDWVKVSGELTQGLRALSASNSIGDSGLALSGESSKYC